MEEIRRMSSKFPVREKEYHLARGEGENGKRNLERQGDIESDIWNQVEQEQQLKREERIIEAREARMSKRLNCCRAIASIELGQ